MFSRLLFCTLVLAIVTSASAQYDQLFTQNEPSSAETITPLFSAPSFPDQTNPPAEVQPAYPVTPYESPIVPNGPLLPEAFPAETTPAQPTPAESIPAPPVVVSPPVEVVTQEAAPTPDISVEVTDELFESAPTEALDTVVADETPEVVHWYYPAYWFGPTPWDSGFELGMNGSSGTSESLSLRTGGFVKRKGKDYKLDLSLYYNKTSTEGEDVQSNALLDARYDWLFEDSRWSLFVMSQTFYDEFQAFDLNVNVNTGVGYQWIDRESTKFSTTFGSGASREFGGVDNSWVPEASFGFNFEQYLSKTRKFYAKMDYFPEWEDFGRYRVLTDIGLEIELSQPSNLSLKFAATDRYDSEPNGVDPRNLNYSALLILKL